MKILLISINNSLKLTGLDKQSDEMERWLINEQY
jgi:hypothetical protein